MSAKAVFVVCAQAFLIQLALGQVFYPSTQALGNTIVENTIIGGSGVGLAGSGLGLADSGLSLAGSGLGLADSGLGLVNSALGVTNTNLANSPAVIVNSNPAYLNIASLSGGGVLSVTSSSPLIPSGMSVVSNNDIEGQVLVNGQLPFLSAVAFEGTLNSNGQGSTSCGCGDGSIGIINESFTPAAGPARGGLGPNGLAWGGYGGRLY